ncbi:MAG: phage holin family protein [Propionibacteriaceae bacterium]|nr:phage holin family protein [Propionibacteriaceae bacterium]
MTEHSPLITSGTPPTPAVREERSIGDLMGDVTRDLSVLLRQEVELAKAELRESAGQAGKGGGMLAGAGVAGFLALMFLSVAAWWALGLVIGNGWSGLVVAIVWAVVAAALAAAGRTELTRVRGLPTTADTVSKIPNALKGNEEDNR